jgi:hypothetical protein
MKSKVMTLDYFTRGGDVLLGMHMFVPWRQMFQNAYEFVSG